MATLLSTQTTRAANQTWDPANNGTGSDGSGFWDTVAGLWASPGDGPWVNGNTAIFGSGGTAGTVTIDDASGTVSAAGLTFNALGSGDYTIAANSGDTLTLTAPTITVNAGSPTISAPIAGTAGLTLAGVGTLNLTGANTYTGATSVNSGTLVVGPGGTLGAAANGLTIGTSNSATTAAVTLNNNITIGALTVATLTNTANTLTLGSGEVLTINGASIIGAAVTTGGANTPGSNLTVTGSTAEVDLNNSLTLGVANTSNGAGGPSTKSSLNLGGIGTFVMNAPTGALNIGTAAQTTDTMTLAPTSSVNVATISVGATGGSNGRSNTLTLGTGTNTIQANTINVGIGKSSGTINIGTGGSVTIAGTGGTGTANITLGGADSGSASDTGTLSLAGHNATVQAGTVIVGRTQGGNATGTGTGVITYDVGTATSGGFNVAQLELAQDTNAGGPAVGTFTLGGSAPSTTADNSVLNVTSAFVLANSSGGKTATGNFFINNGTANISTNIVDNSTAGTHTTNLGLGGAGVLNMNGNSIGTAATPITNVGLSTAGATATLANLGGGGINGAGLTIAPVTINQGATPTSYGVGTLLLAGNNTYTGGTSIASGATLQVGSGAVNGNLPSAGNVTNNGTLTFAQSNSFALNGTISGTGAVNQSGTGTTVVNGPNTYTGATTVSAGTLAGTGSVSDVTISGGTIAPGDGTVGSIGTLTMNSLNMSGGTLLFDVGPTGTSDMISVTNAANFTGGGVALSLSGNVSNGDVFTLLTSSALANSGFALTPVTIGRTTITPSISSNSIIATISGGPASLFWNNAGGSGGGNNWNTTSQNWQNGVNDGAHPDVFFQGDNVTFNDTNNGHYTVSIPAGVTVTPASITVNNNASVYFIGGSGSIGGTTGITKQGAGSLNLTSANSFTGPLNIQNGLVNLLAVGAIPSGASVSLGDGTNSATLNLNTVDVTVSGLTTSGTGASNEIINTGGPATLTFETGTSVFGGEISGNNGLAPLALTVASGSLTLSGANSYTGGTNVAGGAGLTITGSIADPSVTVAAGGTITVALGGNIATNTALTDNGQVNLSNPTQTIGSLNGGGTAALNGTALTVSNGGTFSGTLKDGASAGSLTASGGSLVLSGSSSYTGATNIGAGATVKVANSTSLGATSGTTVGNVFVASGGTLDIGGSATANALNFGAKVFHIQGTGVSNAGAITNSSAITQFTAFNFITLDNDASITGSRIDIGRTPPASTTPTLDLQSHKLTLSMSGAQPIFGILGGVNVTAGQIEVAAGGIDIERTAMVLSDVNGSAITFDTGTVAQFFQNTANDVTRPMTFQGNNVIGGGSTTVGTVNSTMTLNGNVTIEGLASGVPTATANDPINIAGNVVQGTGSSSVTKLGPFNATLSGANTYTGGTTVSAGTLTVAGDGSLPAGGAVTNNATLQVNSNVSPGQITGSGTLALGTVAGPNTNTLALSLGSGQSTQTGLTVNPGSTLDLINNSFDIHYGAGASPDSTIRTLITSGRNGGTWTGTGLTSSRAADQTNHPGGAVGYADGADGVVPGLAAGDELVKYTLAGDANLDGTVSFSDFQVLAENFGASGKWDQADFNYDGQTSFSDFQLLAENFGNTASLSAGQISSLQSFAQDFGDNLIANPSGQGFTLVAVPEPASIGLLGLGALALLGRRRKHA